MIGAFLLFVLWLVGLVVVSVQLFGPSGSIQGTCNLQVFNRNPHGLTQETLAWMQQKNICEFDVFLLFVTFCVANGMVRSMLAICVCYGTDRDYFLGLGHDYGVSSFCQFMTVATWSMLAFDSSWYIFFCLF